MYLNLFLYEIDLYGYRSTFKLIQFGVDRKMAHIKGKSSIPSAISLDIRLEDHCHLSLIVTMHT